MLSTIDFLITLKCNYSCPYCDQGSNKEKYISDSDETVDSFISLISKKEFKNWGVVQLVGGEPTIHNRFFDLAENIVRTGNKLQICTNFSKNMDFWRKLIKLAQNNLHRLQISFHPSQINDIDEFIKKIIEFNKLKNTNTIFIVSACLTEETFSDIKYLKKELMVHNIEVQLQHQRTTSQEYIKYPDELDKYIQNNETIGYIDFSRKMKSFGLKCHSGINFFVIEPDGEAHRCHTYNGIIHSMGNIKDNTFSTYNNVMPCLADKCTCTLAAQCGMIKFNEKNTLLAKIYSISNTKKINVYIKKLLRKFIGLKN